jgi:Family of unknown function (DUF5337)
MASTPKPDHIARKQRRVAIVLVGTMIGWIGVQWLGGVMGWQARYAFLFDLAALAGFLWALVVTYQIWRARRG